MTQALFQAWDHRSFGTATINWTDTSGATSVSVTSASIGTSGSAGLFSHSAFVSVDPKDRGAVRNLGFAALAPFLQTTMDAASGQTITVTFSEATQAYTLTATTGAVFSLTFVGDAGTRMRQLLGFTGNKTGAMSYTSDCRPRFCIRTAIDGQAEFRRPSIIEGQYHSRIADGGKPYAVGPVRLAKTARWEHQHETKAAVFQAFAVADTVVGGAHWTYEDYLDHAARFAVPCMVYTTITGEAVIFYALDGFDADVAALHRADYHDRWIVRVTASSVVGFRP